MTYNVLFSLRGLFLRVGRFQAPQARGEKQHRLRDAFCHTGTGKETAQALGACSATLPVSGIENHWLL